MSVTRMLAPILLVVFTSELVLDTHAAAQSSPARMAIDHESYRKVLPQAETFEREGGLYKHVRGYARGASGESELVGFAFLTRELGARSRGYNGLIRILVGMDLRGRISGVSIVQHYEPYGYRSIDRLEYRKQFEGKSILDAFEVGDDIDAYSGATITTVAATKSIRHAARRMAREFLVKKSESQKNQE